MEVIIVMNSKKEKKKKKKIPADLYGDEFEIEEENNENDEMFLEDNEFEDINEDDSEDLYQ